MLPAWDMGLVAKFQPRGDPEDYQELHLRVVAFDHDGEPWVLHGRGIAPITEIEGEPPDREYLMYALEPEQASD